MGLISKLVIGKALADFVGKRVKKAKEKKAMKEKKEKKEKKTWKKVILPILTFTAGAGLTGWFVYKHKDEVAAVFKGTKLPKGTKLSSRIAVKLCRTAFKTVQGTCNAGLNKVKSMLKAA
jgi:hypothetical protein